MAGRAQGLLLAGLALAALAACHKRGGDDADGSSSRGLQVEAYDPVIPKAPLKGKLDTLVRHPEDTPAGVVTSASSEPAADSSQGAAPKG